ncbi:histone-lysine N-methyltransferase SETMAR [Trichonephila clavipes]|nr:histone-lysine N-methyltransferase SETMAR [Trichonephila clavipes]
MYRSGSPVFEKTGTMFLTTSVSAENIEKVNVPFFNSQSIILKEFLPEGMTMNAARYIEVLTRFMKRLHRFLSNKGGKHIEHLRYSPNLNPFDFLLPLLKLALKGKGFDDIPGIQRNVTRLLNSIPNEDFLQSFQHIDSRPQRYIVIGGDYFEEHSQSGYGLIVRYVKLIYSRPSSIVVSDAECGVVEPGFESRISSLNIAGNGHHNVEPQSSDELTPLLPLQTSPPRQQEDFQPRDKFECWASAHDPVIMTSLNQTKKGGSVGEVPYPKAVTAYYDVMGGVDRFDPRKERYQIR